MKRTGYLRVRWGSIIWMVGAFFLPLMANGQTQNSDSPFGIAPSVINSNGTAFLSVSIRIPAGHHIYAERLSFEWNGKAVSAQLPAAKKVSDKFSGDQKEVFENDLVALLPLPASRDRAGVLAVNFQGCSDSECYFPETREWRIKSDNSIEVVPSPGDSAIPVVNAADVLTNGFKITSRATGFLNSDRFLGFLDQKHATDAAGADQAVSPLARFGLVASLGLILLGGLALNLTPCVLPMIPINLAILGAGARNQNRRRGFALGSAYGGGMALAYGLLGLVVVLTGSRFGALNSSAWFNFTIAVVFVALGLAMFDKLAIDFSRFQRTGGTGRSGAGAFLTAGVMGSFSALLAGACVAPVVISVLLLATTFYQKGNWFGLLLPFVLGTGMALPWPFAAAGLSFLPKPGAWMTRVKYGFGILIFGFAAWYAWLGWGLSDFGHSAGTLALAKGKDLQDLRTALEQSRTSGKPVVVDFWASWCKNCEAMEHSTFQNATVRARLQQDFLFVRFNAEQLNSPELKPVLDQFGVLGLPTCLVVSPATTLSHP